MPLQKSASKRKNSDNISLSKRIFCLGAMLIFFNVGFSQEIDLDSIYQRIQITNDTTDFERLNFFLGNNLELSDSIKWIFYKQASSRAKEVGADYYYAIFIFQQSIFLTISGNSAQAIELANESLEIFLSQKKYLAASLCYNTIGSTIANNGDIQTGKSYLEKAMRYIELEKNNPLYNASFLDHLIVYANILFKASAVDSAFLKTHQALVFSRKNNFEKGEIFCLVNLGKIQKHRKLYMSAKDYLAQALVRLNPTEMQNVKAVTYNHLADIAIADNQIDSAFYFLELGLEVCKANSTFLPIQLDLLSKMAKLYADNGPVNPAYEIQLEHLALKDSFYSLEKEKEIQLVESEFKTREKDRDIELLSQKTIIQALQIKQRNLALLVGVIIVFSALVVAFFIYQSRTNKRERLRTEMLQQTRESELKALKAQMNPHFIFNVLNSIQEYIMLNDKANASDYLSMFSHLIRSYLDQSGNKSIPLKEETETLNRYLQLEALRFEEEFSVRIDVDQRLDQEIIKIPPMIIQPYVENAIKHGLFNKKGAKSLVVAIERDGDQFLKCVVLDNGIGRQAAAKIKASKPNMHESFALGATKSRMKLYNQQSTNKISIEVNDLYHEDGKPSGTQVVILIPLQS